MPVKFSQSEPFDGAVTLEPAQVRFRGELVRGLPRKRVPVNVKLRGILPSDYEVRSIITEPSEVQIEGNSEALEQIEAIDTDVIDVTGMTSDRVLLVPLMEPEGGKISLSKATGVKVSITLTEARAERLITNVPLEIRGTETPQKWVSIPQNVSIGIEGKPSLIASLDQTGEQISAYVDLSNIYMSPVTLPVRAEVKSADELRITRIEPSNVTINTLGDK